MPAARDEIVTIADGVCRGRFDLLGYEGLSFGDPIDWSLDPVSGRRAPRVHWSLLDPLDSRSVGDSKVVWELNRHQWMVDARPGVPVDERERYAEAFVAASHGSGCAPIRRASGINWTSSLEVGAPADLVVLGALALRGSPALSPAALHGDAAAIWAHASHVERTSRTTSRRTRTSPAKPSGSSTPGGLPGAPGAARWRALGARILDRGERAPDPAGRRLLRAVDVLPALHGRDLPALLDSRASGTARRFRSRSRERVERMLDFLLAARCPDGSMPQIGDADGGPLLPLAASAVRMISAGVCSVDRGRVLRPRRLRLGGRPRAPEVLWLLGARRRRRLRRARPRRRRRRRPRASSRTAATR